MEFTGIQIAVSVIVILGAAGVALLCDFLKAKNEQLREAMVELQVRREEEAMRMATAPRRTNNVTRKPDVPVTTPVVEPVMEHTVAPVIERAAATVAAKVAANHSRREIRSNGHRDTTVESLVRKPAARAPKPPVNTAIIRSEDVTAEIASRTGRRQTPPPPTVESVPKKDEIGSNEALADWLRRRAAARSAQTKVSATPAQQPMVAPVLVAPALSGDLAPIVTELVMAAPAAVVEEPAQAAALPEVHIDAFLWESLISGKPVVAAPAVPEKPAAAEIQFQLIRGSSSTSDELLVPAGMHDESTLSRLLSINKPFTGLVVSIAISENDGRAPSNEDVVRAAELHIGSILGDSEFACRTAADEFIMICVGKQGADAQRRLSAIAERLWDYQLRGIGAFSSMMSWGGVDVVNEPLSEAVASATERMSQTKRSRKTVSMDAVNNRRKAV